MALLRYTDGDGTWESTDDGVTFMLVDASQAYRDRQAAAAAKPTAPVDPDAAVEVE